MIIEKKVKIGTQEKMSGSIIDLLAQPSKQAKNGAGAKSNINRNQFNLLPIKLII